VSVDVYIRDEAINVYALPGGLEVLMEGGAIDVVFGDEGPQGAPGQAAEIDMVLGLESLTPGATVSMKFKLASAMPATTEKSRAFTSTPPITQAVTIQLLDNGQPFGTATWEVGQYDGALSFNDLAAPFAAGDVPGFGIPNPLDGAFTQFAITFAA